MATAAVDVGYLAASYSVPETTLRSLLSEPTVELVESLLVQIEAKARAYDDLQSDKVRADVELEAAVQGGEQRARALKTAAEKAQKEAEEARQKLAQEESARQKVEKELNTLQSTATSSSSEVQALESRIKTLESQNRDAIAMHEAKVAAHDRLAQELSEQHQKSIELRKQLSSLEEKNQSLESAASNVKFRETNLQQEIEALRKNNDWYTTELKKRSDDHSKHRKEKSAQIAQLLRDNADASETIDALRRTEATLRQHIAELQSNADEDRKRIDELERQASELAARHQIELDGANRLAELHKANSMMEKQHAQSIQATKDQLEHDAATEVGLLQAELEVERNRANTAEAELANAETLVENLTSENKELRNPVRMPATPRHGINGNFGTPGRAGSPAPFSPGGTLLKADATRTQLLIENNDLKKELRKVREKAEEASTVTAELLREMDARVPEFEELRHENDALTEQCSELTSLLNDVSAEREAARRDARKAQGDLEGVQKECTLLRHQVQDMTIQVRSLMWRREAEENGLDSLPADQKQFILDAVDNQVPDHALPSDSVTHNLITKHLVLYQRVADLQQQHSNALNAMRQLADEHEAQEVRNKLEQHKKDHQELIELRERIGEKEEEIRTLTVRAQTFKAERDMYFRSIPKRDSLSESQSNPAFAQSVPAGRLLEQAPQKDNPDYNKLVEDLKAHIDLLKTESATNNTTNKTQIDSLTKSNSQLQSDKARLETQVRREQDRYTRLEGTIKMLQQEKETLQDRYNNVQATLAKQDDRIVKADQEVAEATTRIQGLESELIHLKASQQVAQSTEARLKERNQELMDERDRLSKLVSDVQSLRNEFELTATNTRRELQAKVEKQDADLQMTQRKLDDELADHKKTIQQRDYERMEAQRRVDDLIAARNSAEVKSASADSVRQQLEQRVKDLQNQLQTAEERLDGLQPRTNGSGDQEDESLSREEELTAQVADLQRKLERKQEDLDMVTSQVEGFQNIAQDAEERLQSFVEAHERLQEELNMAQEEKDVKINDLQQRVDDISSELATSSTELTELRGKHEQEVLQLSQQKDLLETEISRLKNDVADYKEEAAAQAEFVKTQADIAARAQQDYEAELAKHGQTMEKLRTLRDEQDQLKADIAQFKAQAEAARTTLEQSQEHWRTTQGQLEEQITDAKRRHDDLKQYNQTLLNQFDDYKAQIDNLKHNRVTVAGGYATASEPSSNNLQDIETYLRREKEILEVQLNLKEQEAKRLEHQLAHAQTQLDQTREKLIAEQSKAQGSQSNTSIQTLQDRIQELNVYRESNMTLRTENTRLLTQVADKSKALEDLQTELEPLQNRVSELEGELELNIGHLKAVEEDRDRWQKRHQDVLQRYDRIDPKELEDLKQQIENLKVERDQALEQVTALTEKITTLEASQENIVAETREATIQEVKATETAKARNGFNKVHNEKMKQKATEIEGLTNERDELQGELTALKQELEQSQQQLSVARSEASQSQEQMTSLQQQLDQSHTDLATAQQELQYAKAAHDATSVQPNTVSSTAVADVNMSEDGQVQEGGADISAEQIATLKENLDKATQRALTAESNYNVVQNQLSGLQVQLSLERGQVATLEKEIAEKGNTIVELREQLTQAQSQASQQAPAAVTAEPTASPSTSGEVEKLEQELTAARNEVEDLRAQLDAAKQSTNTETPADTPKGNNETVAIQAALDQRETELKALEADVNRRLEEVQIKEAKQAGLVKKANDRIRQIRAETDKELENLKTAHTTELERLREEQQNAAPTTNENEEKRANTPAANDSDNLGQIIGLPTETAEGHVVRDFIQKNQTAKDIVRLNVNKRVAALNEQAAKAKAEAESLRVEYEKLKALVPAGDTPTVKEEPTPNKSEDHEAELAKVKAEHEKTLKEALAKKEEVMARTAQLKGQLKENQINSWKAKWAIFEKAAQETPTEEVAKVYAIAKNPPKAAPKPAVQPNTPAKQGQVQQPGSVQPVPQTPAQSTPGGQQQQQTDTPASNAPQANGLHTSVAGQPAPVQQNPFTQSTSSANGANIPVNPFLQAQMGRGLPQPGFTAPAPIQQQGAQTGFGRGGLQAIRGVIQSNIPRGGGTGIPLPGGRGRGQQNPQNAQQGQQGLNQNLNQNQQQANVAASQIGRGGGRGARGRGNGQQGGGSPGGARGGMNPGAQQFQPGGGAGRGIKRSAEDEGEGGANRGGKRARGGRGGAGAE